MSTVTTNGVRHLTSDEAMYEIRYGYGQQELSDAAAATVASWWQSPGTVGRHFAALASGLPVTTSDLLDDIHATYGEAVTPLDRQALDMLATWALNSATD